MRFMHPILAGAGLLFMSLSAGAAMVVVDGDNVRFTYDDSTQYGSAIVVGDAILFTPTGIIANSLNGGVVSTTKMLNLQVEVLTAGYWLQDFELLEQGDYQLNGAGASATATGTFTVTSNTSAYSDSKNFNGGSLTAQGVLTDWTSGSMISLVDTAGWGLDTDVDIDLSNTLTATTLAVGEQALVQKKFGAVGISITAVPVPAAAWLFGSGLLGLAGFARRKLL